MSHSGAYTTAPIGACTVSLAAIAITAFLSLKNIAATDVLREQVLLLDLTSDAIFVNDMQRVICYWNRGAEALYGWTADEAAGNAAHELVHTVYPRPLAEIYAELLRTGHWEGELTQTRRDQSQVIVASRWSLRRDAQGQAISVLVTNNDITQRKRMESEIQRQQQEIRAAIDAIPAMVWISSPDGRRCSSTNGGPNSACRSTAWALAGTRSCIRPTCRRWSATGPARWRRAPRSRTCRGFGAATERTAGCCCGVAVARRQRADAALVRREYRHRRPQACD